MKALRFIKKSLQTAYLDEQSESNYDESEYLATFINHENSVEKLKVAPNNIDQIHKAKADKESGKEQIRYDDGYHFNYVKRLAEHEHQIICCLNHEISRFYLPAK